MKHEMKRTHIYLSTLQIKNLKEVSKITGYSMAEIIRRAIDEYIEGRFPYVSLNSDKSTE